MSEPKKKYENRLIHEKSPYLLQHAHNPVDWYPWGPEAFRIARDLDKPIFLSIGYATCHWCHTMEKESFENPEVAKLLNEAFVNIKVDREELPEVDSLYMEFSQSMMSGSAGWPLNVILTPDLKPFFAVTYLPPTESLGMMGLIEVVRRINQVWNSEEREKLLSQAEKIVDIYRNNVHVKGDQLPNEATPDEAVDLFYQMADPVYGGMKGSPKFPIAYHCSLLMDYSYLKNEGRALFVAEKTLDMMQRGGIYDHLGGGFSRYAVDEEWLVPHFEKMLVDNALLAHAYLKAWKITKKDFYRNTCEEIIQYALRDMSHPEGGFYSAEDSDSEGVEGLFYTWTLDEIHSVLGPADGELICEFYQVTKEGNFDGRNILHTPIRQEQFAEEKGLDLQEFERKLTEAKHLLFQSRKTRVHPFKDDKILSGWNGLMIHSIVEAGAAFGISTYKEQAMNAARFLKIHCWKDGQLLRRWRDGDAGFRAGLDDYASLIKATLSLFETGCGVEWLVWALEMTDLLSARYKEEGGGFYQTDGEDPHLLIRNCQFSDGADPSGNAIHCENLLRLYQLTYEPRYLEEAGDILMAVNKYLESYSPGYSYHIMNLLRFYHRLAPTIVVALNAQDDLYKEIYKKIYSSFIPHKAIIFRKEEDKELSETIPFLKGQVPLDGKTTVYICHDRVCEKPLTDPQEIFSAFENF